MNQLQRTWLAVVGMVILTAGYVAARSGWIYLDRSSIGKVRGERTNLSIPPDIKRGILTGDDHATRWLESHLAARAGSIPALILLAPRVGIHAFEIPDFLEGFGVCRNSTAREIGEALRTRTEAMVQMETAAIDRYLAARPGNLPTYPRIDFHDRESLIHAYLEAFESGDLVLLYLLIENSPSARTTFWEAFRLQHHNPTYRGEPIHKKSEKYEIIHLPNSSGMRVYLESGYSLTFSVEDDDRDGDLGISFVSFGN